MTSLERIAPIAILDAFVSIMNLFVKSGKVGTDMSVILFSSSVKAFVASILQENIMECKKPMSKGAGVA